MTPQDKKNQLKKGVDTYFADPRRVTHEILEEQVKFSLNNPVIKTVLESVHGFVLILNEQRQILAANQEILDALNNENSDCIVGLRPGEILNCIHFTEGPGGCGTAPHCKTCGAVISILSSQANEIPVTDECRMTVEQDGKLTAIDFQVRVTPLHINKYKLLIFVLVDISSMKRRDVLEQVFLHDFMNMIGGIEGWSKILESNNAEVAAKEILQLTEILKEEVRFQQTLLQAEEGTLKIKLKSYHARDIFNRLKNIFKYQAITISKKLKIIPAPEDAYFITDQALLLRILTNMVKNAYEATSIGGIVLVRFRWSGQHPVFIVHNDAVIPEDIQSNIFDRSFSTKDGKGHGVGTYSMKLFAERYLNGKISFTSNEQTGTTFSLILPKQDRTVQYRPENDPDIVTNSETKTSDTGNQSPPKKHILFIDDEEAILKLYHVYLDRLGYQTTTCHSAEDALHIFRKNPDDFHLIITDFMMPKLTGIELSKQIFNIRNDIPIIITSGFGQSIDKQELKKIGIKDVIKKPINLDEFAIILRDNFD